MWSCYVAQLYKAWLKNCAPLFQLRYNCVENFYYNKLFRHYNGWIIMVFWTIIVHQSNQTKAMQINGVETNKEDPVEVEGCGDIYDNNQDENNFKNC